MESQAQVVMERASVSANSIPTPGCEKERRIAVSCDRSAAICLHYHNTTFQRVTLLVRAELHARPRRRRGRGQCCKMKRVRNRAGSTGRSHLRPGQRARGEVVAGPARLQASYNRKK